MSKEDFWEWKLNLYYTEINKNYLISNKKYGFQAAKA